MTQLTQGLRQPDLSNKNLTLAGSDALHVTDNKGNSMPSAIDDISFEKHAPVITRNTVPVLDGPSRSASMSFRQALTSTDHDLLDTPPMIAQRKGDYLTVKIGDDLVQQGVQQLQNTLIGKLSLASGEVSYSLHDLTHKLGQVWGVAGPWNLIPLGRVITMFSWLV